MTDRANDPRRHGARDLDRGVDAAHDRPTAVELVTAVREWLDSVASGMVEPNAFHARVASNMLTMVERQAELGQRLADEHQHRLQRLGVGSEAELAAGIRRGDFDDRLGEVRAVVLDTVRGKLAVANPRYLDRVDSPDLLAASPSEID